jgi:hypothetical protein
MSNFSRLKLDLAICCKLLFDSLDQAAPILWLSLPCLIGEIMSYGHTSHDQDRCLWKT